MYEEYIERDKKPHGLTPKIKEEYKVWKAILRDICYHRNRAYMHREFDRARQHIERNKKPQELTPVADIYRSAYAKQYIQTKQKNSNAATIGLTPWPQVAARHEAYDEKSTPVQDGIRFQSGKSTLIILDSPTAQLCAEFHHVFLGCSCLLFVDVAIFYMLASGMFATSGWSMFIHFFWHSANWGGMRVFLLVDVDVDLDW